MSPEFVISEFVILAFTVLLSTFTIALTPAVEAPFVVIPIFIAKNWSNSLSLAFTFRSSALYIVESVILAFNSVFITFTTVPSPAPTPDGVVENARAPVILLSLR